MKYLRTHCLLFGLLACLLAKPLHAEGSESLDEKAILGWIEWVYLQPSGLKSKAKLDTGAKTSSLHARNIQHFEKDGEDWVRFQFSSNPRLKKRLYEPGKSKKVVSVEAPLVRHALIKQHKNKSTERPVVLITFSLADQQYQSEFTLTDRGKFNYPILLGRSFLRDVAIVDPGHTFLKTHSKLKLQASKEANTDRVSPPAKADKQEKTETTK